MTYIRIGHDRDTGITDISVIPENGTPRKYTGAALSPDSVSRNLRTGMIEITASGGSVLESFPEQEVTVERAEVRTVWKGGNPLPGE